jgi:hypothetical protein
MRVTSGVSTGSLFTVGTHKYKIKINHYQTPVAMPLEEIKRNIKIASSK